MGLEPTLLVKDEKVWSGSTESRNWPFGDSNLSSMIGLYRDVGKVVFGADDDLFESKAPKTGRFFPHNCLGMVPLCYQQRLLHIYTHVQPRNFQQGFLSPFLIKRLIRVSQVTQKF